VLSGAGPDRPIRAGIAAPLQWRLLRYQ